MLNLDIIRRYFLYATAFSDGFRDGADQAYNDAVQALCRMPLSYFRGITKKQRLASRKRVAHFLLDAGISFERSLSDPGKEASG